MNKADFSAQQIARLSPEKRQLLELRLEQKRASKIDSQDVTRTVDRCAAPLSLVQQRLWFLNQLEPNSALYNISHAYHLTGEVDADMLAASLNEIVRRHASLRTTFAEKDGEPVQIVHPALHLPLPVADLSGMPEATHAADMQRLVQESAEQPFDLEQGPLLRFQLVRLTQRDYVLALTMHHIVFDGWSLRVFCRELGALYDAYRQGQPSPLPELPVQCADFAVWQRERLQGEELDRQLDYWKRQLAGCSVLHLPTDRPRPPVQSYRSARCKLVLSERLTCGLKTLSQRENTTLFTALLAAFQLLLHRYTGQEDIVVGVPKHGRNWPEVENLIGFFVNTLVLRTDLSGNPTFKELLGRVREVALAAYAHEDVPFEKLVEELRPARDPSRNLLFDVLINFLGPAVTLHLKDIGACELDLEEELPAKFAMTLYIEQQENGLGLKLAYQQDLFAAERITALLLQYRYLLEQIVASPETPCLDYSLVPDEIRQLLPDPQAVIAEPPQTPVPELFAAWVGRAPQQVAISQGNRQWNYGELAERAEALALALRERGIRKGDVVAVAGSRNFGLIAGMLAVFRSGGVLLSLDDALPDERRRLMLKQASAKLWLHVGPAPADNPALDGETDVDMLRVDSATGKMVETEAARKGDSSLPVLSGDDPAYIFFTSGSTDIPKGILGCHKGLSHFLNWQRNTFAIGKEDRVAQLTALSFDVVLRDIYLPLTSGGTLCLPEEHDLGNVPQWLEKQRITVLHTVPTIAQSWLSHVQADISLPTLRWIFMAGEPLLDTLIEEWRRGFPSGGEIINLYGPTETTLVKCCYRVPEQPFHGIQPAGRSLPQTQALVLNAGNRLCGIGEPGEIVLRTPFRSLGYLNSPEETRKRFMKNPFRDDEEDLLYYTGDGGRYRPDGILEILGRLDDQVKIRGVRIEPAEVTAVLARHPAVEACVVISLHNEQAQPCLAAYVVVASGLDGVAVQDLRSYLGKHLPPVMVPTAFVFLDQLPRLPNGKVDRRALPAPVTFGQASEAPYAPPSSSVEETLVGIWAELLHRKRVGVHDNFFELGGHSLLAVRILSRICDHFQVGLPLRTLFDAPTVAGLANVIAMARNIPAAHRWGANAAQIEKLSPEKRALLELRLRQKRAGQSINRRERGGPLPLSFAQQRLWFLDRLMGSSAVYNMLMAFRLTGSLDTHALAASLNEILMRHEALRTVFAARDGEPYQIINAAPRIALPCIDLSAYPQAGREQESRRLMQEEAERPFDLEQDLLLRARLLRLADEDHVLALTMHHIASDGWSRGVLARELGILYQAFVQGEPSPLPELPVQYADYAIWQREWLQGGELDRQLDYWKQQLAGLPVLELPTDRPRPPVQGYKGGLRPVQLPATLTEALKNLSRRENATLFMTLTAAFQTLLSRYSGQEDFALGTPIAGRNRSEIENLIGFFVNTLVLRGDLSGNPTFKELLARVRETALGAYAHQDLSFEKLVEELHPERDMSRSPLFQVMLVLQNTPTAELALSNLTLSRIDLETDTAKFDLSLSLSECAEGLQGSLEYNSDLYDPQTIDRMICHYRMLLEGIAANPEARLSELPLLTGAEQQQLLVDWNATAVPYPAEQLLQQRFEEQVRRTPDHLAVQFRQHSLSYAQLNSQANRLAHHLRSLGIGADSLVGLCVERSLDMVVGMLAILKAGGAYVPLDPDYPQDRLDFMLQDTGAKVVLTQFGLKGRLPESAAHLLCLDSDSVLWSAQPDFNPAPVATPDNLAYVIYTSGSTGQPKGVMVTQRSICNHMQWMAEAFAFSSTDALLQKTSINSDASVWEFYAPLLAGGRLVMAEPGAHRDPAYLARAVREYGITHLQLVPIMLRALVAEPEFRHCTSLRVVYAGGEALERDLVESFRQQLAIPLCNLYGPTEATIDSHCWMCGEETSNIVPIGRPISNTVCYVLDAQGNLSPIGVAGELYIGGDGLARGYLNRPELTAERFVPSPFKAGERLYRTGDRVRWREDGVIEFLGRIDHQIKLRGYRIEPGEIEAVLQQDDAIQQSLVMVREDRPGDRRLVAYLVGQGIDVEAQRARLKGRLPDYMIPAALVVLDSLPLTPNGKVDRKALPAPQPEAGAAGYQAPRTPLETTIAAIWAETLHLPQVGIHDNFFDLGGHSLLAAQTVNGINRALEIDLGLRQLFDTPTVHGLALAALDRLLTGLGDAPNPFCPP